VAVQTGVKVPPDDVSVNVHVNPLQDFESVAVGFVPVPPPELMKPTYSSLLGVPDGTLLIALLVAFVMSAFVTSVTLAVGLAER
jgi:hypothetical protein